VTHTYTHTVEKALKMFKCYCKYKDEKWEADKQKKIGINECKSKKWRKKNEFLLN
jgi:hypothetical protein